VDLPVHLEGQHTVTFPDHTSNEGLQEKAENAKTKLMAYFECNQVDEEARSLLYQDMPHRYTWQPKEHLWKKRAANRYAFGRMHFVGPSGGERYYLRTLLTVVKGARSFEELRTYEGRSYPTFQEACIARGLLESDDEWERCLDEAAQIITSGAALRHLFIIILTHSNPQDPKALWERFKDNLCEGLLPHAADILCLDQCDVQPEDVWDLGLFEIEKMIHRHGKTFQEDFKTMPCPQKRWDNVCTNRLIAEQLNYDCQGERSLANTNISKFNPGQKAAFDCIFHSVMNADGGLYFLHGPGGTGKSFVWNTLAHACRAEGKIVLCVASSGIAAILLPGGRTSHSMFGIPLSLDEFSTSTVTKGTHKAELFKKVSILL
jgi:hypothetical protein